MERLKKHKVPVIVIAILILAAAVLLIYRTAVLKSPERILEQYMACIEKQDYESMYGMLDQKSRNEISKKEFVTRNRNIYEGIGAENITIRVIREKEDAISYRTIMDSSAGEIRFPNEMEIHREDGRYRITWNDSLIFPQLGSEDTVKVVTLEADRGSIYDRNGTLLAGKGTVASVGLIPGKMNADASADLKKMAELLDMSVSDIEDKLSADWVRDDLLVPIKKLKKVNEKSSSTVDLKNAEVQKKLLEIPGVIIGDEESRVYPLAEDAAHLVGYVQGISAEELETRKNKGYDEYSVIGKSGLERLYEQRLHGIDGEKIVIYNEDGNEKAVLAETPQKDGEDIHLTIDARLQSALYDTYRNDKSCTAAINPKTGEVLALVSTPSYDSNDFVVGMSENRWKELNEDKDSPMYNRFAQSWCPGSSLKPIVGAIGITSDRLDPEKDMGHSGLSWQKNGSWGGYKVTTLHEYSGSANLKNALVYSDNIYFAKAALQIGAETLAEQFKKVGFGQELPFPVSMSQSQYTNDGKPMATEIQLADSGYGQGEILVNPLHMACMYSAFANDGSMIAPYLETSGKRNVWKKDVFSKEAVSQLRSDLIQVIQEPEGTGHGARLTETVLAGKTGTAEIKASQDDTSGTELGWFCVYNANGGRDDSLLLVTMTEDVKDRGGSTYVVKNSRNILKRFMPAD